MSLLLRSHRGHVLLVLGLKGFDLFLWARLMASTSSPCCRSRSFRLLLLCVVIGLTLRSRSLPRTLCLSLILLFARGTGLLL